MNVYFRLMRFDKPAGIALLWAPTAWALWLAHHGRPAWHILVYFLLGTTLMRAAGCVFNDIADRRIDKYVKRTKNRPLTSGEITLTQARVVLVILLSLAALVLWQLPILCWWLALMALIITFAYPYGKRFFHAPQLILGVAFSMGIPMAYAASHAIFDGRMAGLMILNFLWIVAYDTIYALMDQDDDRRLGVHSTAIFFGTNVLYIILGLQMVVHSLWWMILGQNALSLWFMFAWLIGLSIFGYQYVLLKYQNTQDTMHAFLWNAVYGLVMWIGLM